MGMAIISKKSMGQAAAVVVGWWVLILLLLDRALRLYLAEAGEGPPVLFRQSLERARFSEEHIAKVQQSKGLEAKSRGARL